jgi:hypothetical protein
MVLVIVWYDLLVCVATQLMGASLSHEEIWTLQSERTTPCLGTTRPPAGGALIGNRAGFAGTGKADSAVVTY